MLLSANQTNTALSQTRHHIQFDRNENTNPFNKNPSLAVDLNNWYLDFGWVKLRLLGGLGLWGFGCSYWFGLFLLLGGHADGYDATQRDRDGTGSDTLWVKDSMLRDDTLSSD